eukprot:TRINITY_DN9982_c0_g1_i10.p1 TRINITY_DN9982_c0_g1~~TRINITY_DN9982_c0_g1_i10.p1  ORF type:complete len:252 (-),score=67.14 TRINITY_DN9982_c0_g1_i10:68-823(-)
MKARADPEVLMVADRLHPYYWARVKEHGGGSSSSSNGSESEHCKATTTTTTTSATALPKVVVPPVVEGSGGDAMAESLLDAFAPLSQYSKPKSYTKATQRAERKLLLRAVKRMARQTELDLFGTSSDGAVAAACYLHEDRATSRRGDRSSRLSSESETPGSPEFMNTPHDGDNATSGGFGGCGGGGSYDDEDEGNSPYISSLSSPPSLNICLLYTSDAADEEDSVDLGGRRIIKKKKKNIQIKHKNKNYIK